MRGRWRALVLGAAICALVLGAVIWLILPDPTPTPDRSAAQTAPELGLPIDCDLGVDCWVSTYFDHDDGEAWSDHACGPVTYDTHGGVDFAIPNNAAMRRGVPVVASAPGVVTGLRDEMPDVSIARIGRDHIKGRDCGNGVVLDHGGGWQTQYCHLRRGSIGVSKGERVEAGAPLGLVGLSGRTEHPHVHLTVRKDGRKIDPFTGGVGVTSCGDTTRSIWRPDLREKLRYRTGIVRGLGFSFGPPSKIEARDGRLDARRGAVRAPALVFWADVMGNWKDHGISVVLRAPDGEVLAESEKSGPSVYQFLYTGRKRPDGGWPAGTYVGEVEARDGDGRRTDFRRATIELR